MTVLAVWQHVEATDAFVGHIEVENGRTSCGLIVAENDPNWDHWFYEHERNDATACDTCAPVAAALGITLATPITERLEYLRSQIDAECISQGELIELQGLADYIEPGDVQLLEAAGVPEFPHECTVDECGATCWINDDGKPTRDVRGSYMGDGEGPCDCDKHAVRSYAERNA